MRATASKTGLLLECSAWARDNAAWGERADTLASSAGTAIHARLEAFAEGRLALEDCKNADDLALHTWLFVKRSEWRLSLLPEVPFAWDPATDTAVQLVKGAHREYVGAKTTDFCGTVDLCAYDEKDGHAYVWDLFTGHDWSHKVPQQRALSLMLARAWGATRVTWNIEHLVAGEVRTVKSETMDTFALAATAGDLAGRLAAVATADPVPGSHCTEQWCPHIEACKATREVVDALVPPEALLRFGTNITGPAHAAWLLHRRSVAQDQLEAVGDALKAYARANGGIRCPDGTTWTETVANHSRFDKEGALGMLRAAGASPAAIASLTIPAPRKEFRKVRR